MSLFGLPPIPPELKPIAPFIQRADELKQKDPIIAYWCLYHAAQVGLSLKPSSPQLLYTLLGVLEDLKRDIGPNDAVDVESASIAYVENFALKVFAAADDEDRRGVANRSTAKKFLAAAHFLQVLHIFPKSEISESNEEKMRYAKWKAADIAKAFREERVPQPGPPQAQSQLPSAPSQSHLEMPSAPPISESQELTPPLTPPRTHPSPRELTPGGWSTTATPGMDGTPLRERVSSEPESPTVVQRQLQPHQMDSFTSVHVVEYPSAPPLPRDYAPPRPPPPPLALAQELSPELISKAQKHCRYAISALDYEDSETAKRELRAALALLSG